jgi:hypothetical protein
MRKSQGEAYAWRGGGGKEGAQICAWSAALQSECTVFGILGLQGFRYSLEGLGLSFQGLGFRQRYPPVSHSVWWFGSGLQGLGFGQRYPPVSNGVW